MAAPKKKKVRRQDKDRFVYGAGDVEIVKRVPRTESDTRQAVGKKGVGAESSDGITNEET